MNISMFKNKLLSKGYKIKLFEGVVGESLFQNSIEVFTNGNRVLAVKEYINEFQFNNWVDVDKVNMSIILKDLNYNQKNNLYFLICISSYSEINSVMIESINEIEKDDKICRKYVLLNDYDIERIPFLSESIINTPEKFDYEEKFKEKLRQIDGIKEDVVKIAIEYFEQKGGEDIEN